MTAETNVTAPVPAVICETREAAGLTVRDAATMVHTYPRLWRYWESGAHRMPPAIWELFRIKVAMLEGAAK